MVQQKENSPAALPVKVSQRRHREARRSSPMRRVLPRSRPRADTCLVKEYLDTGVVQFRDVCTREWATNSIDSDAQASKIRTACLTKQEQPRRRDVQGRLHWRMGDEYREADGCREGPVVARPHDDRGPASAALVGEANRNRFAGSAADWQFRSAKGGAIIDNNEITWHALAYRQHLLVGASKAIIPMRQYFDDFTTGVQVGFVRKTVRACCLVDPKLANDGSA